MKKSIIIPSVIIICLLFIGLYITKDITRDINRAKGILIEKFSDDEENKFFATVDLDKYDYVKLLDVYYHRLTIDPYYIISFKVPKSHVEEFENSYLIEHKYSVGGDFDFARFFPNRDYSPKDCKVYHSFEHNSTVIYVKEHDEMDYYEYHIRNIGNPNPDTRHLIQEQVDNKNYRVIGMLKSVYS